MRFSIAFLLSTTAWVTFLPVAISATIREYHRIEQAPAATIGLLSFLYVAFASLNVISKAGIEQHYWKGSCIFCYCFVGFLLFQNVHLDRSALGPVVAFVGSKLSTESASSVLINWDEDPIANVLEVWLIPVFGTIGGIIAEFVYREPIPNEKTGG